MPKLLDLTNMQFGRLKVLERDYNSKYVKWVCKCECGNTKSIRSCHLTSGYTRSCGCLLKETTIKRNKIEKVKHGLLKSRLYAIWHGMKQRCYDPNRSDYKNYGGRDIKVCDEWLNDFQTFYDWSIENGYSDDLTIDRIDNDKDYCPNNCRWITTYEQNRHRGNSLLVSVNNYELTLTEWSIVLNVSYPKLYRRYKLGTIREYITELLEMEEESND